MAMKRFGTMEDISDRKTNDTPIAVMPTTLNIATRVSIVRDAPHCLLHRRNVCQFRRMARQIETSNTIVTIMANRTKEAVALPGAPSSIMQYTSLSALRTSVGFRNPMIEDSRTKTE